MVGVRYVVVVSMSDSKVIHVTDAGADADGEKENNGISVVVLIIAIIASLGVGFGACYVMVKKDFFIKKEGR